MKYQRFVAYVYEYRKGKKENNCGFLRVEARDESVTVEVHIKCPGLPADEKCSVYGFIRKAGLMDGILLGDARSGKEKLDCVMESEKGAENTWKEEFPQFGGMVILTEHGAFFGTEWDDQLIKPENFEVRKAKEKSEEACDNNKIEEKVQPKSDIQLRLESNAESNRNLNAESSPESNRNLNVEPDMKSNTRLNVESSPESNMSLNVESDVEQNMDLSVESDSKPNIDLEMESSVKSDKVSSESVTTQEVKQPTFCPFNDDEISECRKVHPNDFFRSCPRACALRNNRFLEHGYYNFGHLLVGKRADGQRILGVPGGYDQQERFMANMFGFPYFKESREIQLPGGRGGYWYRLINPANFH